MVFWFATAFAQTDSTYVQDIYVYGKVKDHQTGDSLPNVDIIVVENGLVSQELVSNGRGFYEFYLDLDHEYMILYTTRNKVSKHIYIDARGVPPAAAIGGFGMNVDMTLFDKVEGEPFTILDEPIGVAAFGAEDSTMAWDYEYTQIRQDSLRMIFKRIDWLEDN